MQIKTIGWRRFALSAAVVVGLFLLELFFFRDVLNTTMLFGDAGDGRFNNLLAEHWFRVFTGKEGMNQLPTFYPVSDTLGYSDILLGFGIPYSVLRLFGMDMFLANKVTIMLVHAMGTFSMYYLLRRKFQFRVSVSFAGTIAFMLSNAFSIMFVHTQLIFLAAVPLLAVFLYGFFENIKADGHKRVFYGAAALLWFGLILCTSFYIAYFTLLFGLGFVVVYCILQWCSRGRVFLPIGRFIKRHWLECLLYLAAVLIWAVPFLILYLPVLKTFGERDFTSAVLPMLPSWFDFFNCSPRNESLGPWVNQLLEAIRPGFNERPFMAELWHGFTPILFLSFAAAGVFAVVKFGRNTRKNKGDQMLLRGKSQVLLRVVCAAFLTVVLFCILLLKVDGQYSLWYYVYSFFPGASAIRAISRFLAFFMFPAAVVIAYVLQHLLRNWKDWKAEAVGFVAAAVLLWDSLCIIPANWNREEQLAMLAAVPDPPAECEIMFVYYGEDSKIPGHITQQDGWLIAYDKNLLTINGNSGQFPLHWGMYHSDQEDYLDKAAEWIEYNHLENVYFYNPSTQEWSLFQPE